MNAFAQRAAARHFSSRCCNQSFWRWWWCYAFPKHACQQHRVSAPAMPMQTCKSIHASAPLASHTITLQQVNLLISLCRRRRMQSHTAPQERPGTLSEFSAFQPLCSCKGPHAAKAGEEKASVQIHDIYIQVQTWCPDIPSRN